MPKFRVNSWLQLNSTGFRSNVTLWLSMKNLEGEVTCDNVPRSRGKLSHHIISHKKSYPNSIKQSYQFHLVRCNMRKHNVLQKVFIGRKYYK